MKFFQSARFDLSQSPVSGEGVRSAAMSILRHAWGLNPP